MASTPAHSPEAGGTPLSSKHQELLGVLNQDIKDVISKFSEEGFSILNGDLSLLEGAAILRGS